MVRVSLEPDRVLLGKYRIERILGQGGMGTVVRARHLSLDEVVAIKVLSNRVGLTDELAQRFTREARAAAKLRSRHAVRVTDVGQLDDGQPYLVMELLEGSDLAQLVKAQGALDPRLAVMLVLQACEVLAEAHAQGIVHRDIKPSNLFATTGDDGAPFLKVLDFGIAKTPDANGTPITRTLSLLGTPGYMSPEQLRSARMVDRRTDIWALGIVLYELIEGRRPFDAAGLPELCMQITTSPVPPLVRAPVDLTAIVTRCLEKEPERRYQTIEALATELARLTADPVRTARDLERMRRLMHAGGARTVEPAPPRGRLDTPTAAPAGIARTLRDRVDVRAAPRTAETTPLRGRLDAPAAAPADHAEPAPARGQFDEPTAAPANIAPATIVVPGMAAFPAAPSRRRRAPILLAAAIVVAAAAISFALQFRARPRPAPDRDMPARTTPITPTLVREPLPAPQPDAAAAHQAPVEPITQATPVEHAIEAPGDPPARVLPEDPTRPGQRTHRNVRGNRRDSATPSAAPTPPGNKPAVPPGSGSDARTPSAGDTGSGNAKPCDPYSRLGC